LTDFPKILKHQI